MERGQGGGAGLTEFWAAIIGALVGGAITALTQLMSFRWQQNQERARRREDFHLQSERQLEREATLAFSILAKMNRGFTAITQVRDILDSAHQLMMQAGMEFANAARPTATDPESFRFSLDEMILVRDLRKTDLINNFLDLPYIVDGYIGNIAVFRRIKSDINGLAEVGRIEPDGRAISGIHKKNEFRHSLLVSEANVLLNAMHTSIAHDFKNTNNLFHDLHAALQDRLGGGRMKVDFEVERIN